MEEKVFRYIQEQGMTSPGEHIICGLSGGADSVCLLLILNDLKERLGITLSAVHVEHNIRGEEGLRDAEFARQLCIRLKIPFYIYHADAPKISQDSRRSLEEAARDARIRCIEDAVRTAGADKAALAHHAGDCAETVLFNMARGSAVGGIKGISPVTVRKEYTIIRPLLCVERKHIEEFLREKRQDYCTDSTNSDLDISRNRIRKKVIPELEIINEKAVSHIARSAGLTLEAYDFISVSADNVMKDLVSYKKSGDVFCASADAEKLSSLHPALLKFIIHRLISEAAGGSRDITVRHVESVIHILDAGTGKCVSLPGNVRAFNQYGKLFIDRGGPAACDERPAPEGVPLAVPGMTVYKEGLRIETRTFFYTPDMGFPRNSYTKWFDYDKISGTLFVRTRRNGDFLLINPSGGRKKLKDIFIDEKIPRGERDKAVLIADGPHIVWILGLRISEAYKITDSTRRVLSISIREG